MNLEESAQLVGYVLVAWPAQGSKLNDPQQVTMAKVWRDALGDLTYEQCQAAVCVLVQTRQFMPTVAEVRGAVLELEHGPVRSGGDAWGEVLDAMKNKGAWKSPGVDFVFDDPATTRCVKCLGWRDLCLSENTIADRARFIELYDKVAADRRRESQAPQLAAAREQREQREQRQVAGQPATIGKLLSIVAKTGGDS